jgi:hypothetical protein
MINPLLNAARAEQLTFNYAGGRAARRIIEIQSPATNMHVRAARREEVRTLITGFSLFFFY